jgi:hypothetical protein
LVPLAVLPWYGISASAWYAPPLLELRAANIVPPRCSPLPVPVLEHGDAMSPHRSTPIPRISIPDSTMLQYFLSQDGLPAKNYQCANPRNIIRERRTIVANTADTSPVQQGLIFLNTADSSSVHQGSPERSLDTPRSMV